jgi:hypothetical protein
MSHPNMTCYDNFIHTSAWHALRNEPSYQPLAPHSLHIWIANGGAQLHEGSMFWLSDKIG